MIIVDKRPEYIKPITAGLDYKVKCTQCGAELDFKQARRCHVCRESFCPFPAKCFNVFHERYVAEGIARRAR